MDFYYSIFCIFIMIVTTFILYQAIMFQNKTAIILICIHLAIMHGDKIFKDREDSIAYGFFKGFTQEEPKNDEH